MRKRNSNFRRGIPTYKCGCCGILTRETGDGESGCELCVDCYNLAGLDNGINDDGREPSESELRESARRLATIAAKGGNVERVIDMNEYLFAKGAPNA